ncbi:growth arrest-specific protein 6-like isoform X2 [Narcine bancroftii]|uniref:growth arrest-specific protein 6-like isoform X2 n=1 Tax=Narcine bancroftii TaxID=1343680 RepID=UPI0038321CEE
MSALGGSRTAGMLGVLALLLLLGVPGTKQFVSRRSASSFLLRSRRANHVFEETRQGHLERECVEEFCSKEEAREVFENDPETNYFYPKYRECLSLYGPNTKKSPDLVTCVHNIPNQCSPLPCYSAGFERCEDRKGAFKCVCKQGWSGVTCHLDVDECQLNNGGCEHICSNVVGSYQCACRTGFDLLHDKHRCMDINECALDSGLCGSVQCVNTLGSYVCRCDSGYKYNTSLKSCQDINECEDHLCAGECVNTPGRYSCYCDGKQELKLAADLQNCLAILPCVSLNTVKNEGSLYLGRFFQGIPVLHFNFKRKQQTRFSVEFDLRTFDTEGTIFQAGHRQNNEWIMLALYKGKLQVQYCSANKATGLTTGGPYLNDGRWHTISVEESTNSLIVKVAREAVMNINIPHELFVKILGMFQIDITVGGLFNSAQLVKPINPRLDACLRGWNWMQSEDTIRETIEHEDRMQCFSQLERGSYYPGYGGALFDLSYGTQIDAEVWSWALNIDLSIRPSWDTGVLVALVNGSSVPLSLAITDLNRTAKGVVLAIENVVAYQLDLSPLCAGDKTAIQLSAAEGWIILKSMGVMASSPLETSQLAERLSTLDRYMHGSVLTYLGGVPDVPITAAPVTAFYQGCLDVRINNHNLDLDEAVDKNNDIRSHSCPMPSAAT